MSLRSLDQLLSSLERQSPSLHQFQQLLRAWTQAVGAAIAAQTRPIAVERGTLYVATSSSAWAQELVFRRRKILQALNAALSEPLSDIRFSTAQWQEGQPERQADGSKQQMEAWLKHPSRLGFESPQEAPLALDNPTEAFKRWAEEVRSRRQTLPLCPQCQCPTPIGELQRWQVCGVCAARQWQAQQ